MNPPDTRSALRAVGVLPDAQGDVELFHATSRDAADSIIEQLALLPTLPCHIAERMLARGVGDVYLSSSPSIKDDLPGAEVVLMVVVDLAALPEFPSRPSFGEPPRVELQVKVKEGEVLRLRAAELWEARSTAQLALSSDPESADEAATDVGASEDGRCPYVAPETGARCMHHRNHFGPHQYRL